MTGTRNIKYYLAASVALITLVIYLPALQNAFVNWDDNVYIYENPHIRFDAAFFKWAFFDFYDYNWFPLTWMSHALDYSIWGLNPLGHHLTNIILHSVNTFLVVVLVIRLLATYKTNQNLPQRHGGTEKSIPKIKENPSLHSAPLWWNLASYEIILDERTMLIAAGVTGLLFGIHPLHVESVAWAAERKDLLCALFYLLSVMAYVGYADDVSDKAHRAERRGSMPCAMRFAFFTSKHYFLTLGFFVLALLSKPMAVTLPVVLLILDWHPFGRITSIKTAWSALVEKLPLIALSLVSAIVTIVAQWSLGAMGLMEIVPLQTRVLVAAKSFVAYLGKMLWPRDLVPFYPYPGQSEVSLFSLAYLSALIFIIGLTIAFVVMAKKRKLLLAAWGFFVVTLAPVIGVIQVGGQSMADRYTYLPSLGPFMVIGLAAAWLWGKVNVGRKGAVIKALCAAPAIVVFAVLSYLTVMQIGIWKNSIILWNNVIEKEGDKISFVYNSRAEAFKSMGMDDRAIADFNMAIHLDPSYYFPYLNRGLLFSKMGRFDDAIKDFTTAIGVNPVNYKAYNNRAITFQEAGLFDKAIEDFDRAIALAPENFEAYSNEGILYVRIGLIDKAVDSFNRAVAVMPNSPDAHSNRGLAYSLKGQYDRALEDYNKAIALDRNYAVAYYNRGKLHAGTGKAELARADFQQACNLGHENACHALH